MTDLKLHYTIKKLEDGKVCFNVGKSEIDKTTNYTEANIIDLPKNGNKIVEPLPFGKLLNVTSLLISNCQLLYLPDELQFIDLIELDISNNLLKQVPDFVIHRNTNLQILNISQNNIMEFNLEPKCYNKLKYLNLGSNQLQHIPQWIFNSPCTALEMLDLSNNPFDHKTQFLFGRNLIKLCCLELSNANLQNFLKCLQEIPHMKKLSISNNGKYHLNAVHELPFKAFASAPVLLDLQFSAIGYSYLSDEVCELSALEILNISYNHISWLPKNFANLKTLQILDVSHNELFYLPSDIHELKNLTELHLSHNIIGSLPESLTTLNKLKLLDCYSNDLIQDSLLVVSKISSLVAFDVEQNSFTTTDDQHYLEMRNNIWKDKKNRICGCKLVDVSDEEEKSYSSIIGDESDYELEVNVNNDVEENWDCDSDSIGDDSLLVLPPYKFKLIRKPVLYNPSDYINPIYFEDALEDET